MANKDIHAFYNKMAATIKDPKETRNKAKDFSEYDIALVRKLSANCSTLLDLGAGSGLLVNNILDCFDKIVAVEKYDQFSQFIERAPNVEIISADLLNYNTEQKFDMVSLFGVMNFFDEEEAKLIYGRIRSFVKPNGFLVVKNQMGVNEDIRIKGFSEELQTDYYSDYRWVEREKKLIEDAGFKITECVDIYPPEYNRWDNTHFYALIAQ